MTPTMPQSAIVPADEASQATKELSAHVKQFCHDLSNPVAVVKGNTQLLSLMVDGEEARACLEDIKVASDQIVDLLVTLKQSLREEDDRAVP